MSQSPFAKRFPSQGAQTCGRRSTRVDRVVPMVLSGRDASGQVFREETETCTVNLHGARLQTRHQILVGMQVTVENPASGKAEKAICVRVEPPQPGEDFHYIAVQLVHPCNLWDITDPPEDWARVQAEMIDGVVPSRHEPAKLTRPAPTHPPPTRVAPQPDPDQIVAEIERKAVALIEPLVANLRRQTEEIVVEAFGQFEARLEESAARAETRASAHAEQALAGFKSAVEACQVDAVAEIGRQASQAFEQHVETALATADSRMTERAGRVSGELESALETFRADTMGEIVRDALQSFEEQMKNVVADAETHVAQRSERAFADLEKAFETFRAGVADELDARKGEVVESTEQALRGKVATMLSSILGQSASVQKEADPTASKK